MSEGYKKLFSFLSYYNFIEYVIPAIILCLLLYFDLFIAVEYSMAITLSSIIGKLSFFIILLFIIGWLMYATRFYRLFPGYAMNKKKLYFSISRLLYKDSMNSNNYRQAIGKYIYYKHWKKLDVKDHKHTLTLHVNWVCIVHICNALMVSFLFVIVLILFKIITLYDNNSQFLLYISRPSLLILIILHPVLYFYFRFSAIRNLKRSNANILDNINRMKIELENDIPSNIGEYIEEYY